MERKKIQVNSVLMRVILDPKNIKHVKGKKQIEAAKRAWNAIGFYGLPL
jgi:hypothetical protein